MVTIHPKVGDFLLKTTNSVNLDDALNRIIKEYIFLKIHSLEENISSLKKKYNMDYSNFIELYKKNHSQDIEEDFYQWDEYSSLLEYYKEIREQWIL
jgi:hypothetical protein